MIEHKILFTGTTGAGKTTAIACVSEIPPLTTDVRNHDESLAKTLTTVGLDYGELTLENGHKLRLYGTPGQSRFDFMWQILSRGALGLIILIDNSRAAAMEDLDVYIKGFAALIADTACVVAIGRMDMHPVPDVDSFSERLAQHGVLCPVVPTDVRDPEAVSMLLDLLLTQLEIKAS